MDPTDNVVSSRILNELLIKKRVFILDSSTQFLIHTQHLFIYTLFFILLGHISNLLSSLHVIRCQHESGLSIFSLFTILIIPSFILRVIVVLYTFIIDVIKKIDYQTLFAVFFFHFSTTFEILYAIAFT